MSALEPEIDHAKVSEILASAVCCFQEGSANLDMSVICALVQEAYVHTDSVFYRFRLASSALPTVYVSSFFLIVRTGTYHWTQ